LVVAENAERRAFLAESAREAGWEITACRDASAASVAANRFHQSLAIVDLADLEPGAASGFRTLTEQLTSGSSPLVMICGAEGNALEEIWARQLGVWLYLSGVDPTCDVTGLCHEAKQVVQKLNREPVYARTA
jgi:DNA-binding response OmpR family regulator